MRLVVKFLLFLFLLITVLLTALYLRSPIAPFTWEPAPNPGLTGRFAQNQKLGAVRLLLEDVGKGPEDIAIAPGGVFFTGFEDGRIVRFTKDGQWSVFSDTGGRPLGMQLDHQGNLIVADAVRGLLSVRPDGEIEVLADHADGQRMRFVDDLDIAADGTIWFSDASTRFAQEEYILNFIEARPTGRLLTYSPATKTVTVRMEGLMFANGVALGPNEDYVLVAETGTGRIQRLWLKGERLGDIDYFHPGLPGYPDNLSFNGKDRFWVAINTLRTAQTEALSGRPLIRKLLGGVPLSLLPEVQHYGFVVALDLEGNVVANLQAPGSMFHQATSVNQAGTSLLIGSLGMAAVGLYDLPAEFIPD